MKRYLLDTNVISETRKPKPHGALLAWMATLHVEQIIISAVTLGELQTGVERARRQDTKKAEEIERWVDDVAASLQVLPMDDLCFRQCARLMEGRPGELFTDGMIAATALVHGLTVATRNERDFAQLDVPVFNPFKYSK